VAAGSIIEVENLRRVFRIDRMARREAGKELIALDDVSLRVQPGEIFGLLGPNGAGKTTLIRILCTLLAPTAGRAAIDGLDVVKDTARVRRLINMVSGGETCGYGILTARENLRLFTELYGIPWRVARPRVEYMLKVVGLEKKQSVRTNKLSSGMRQRLNFARGFINHPRVLFLDEPTIGLDVHSARQVRSFIKMWVSQHRDSAILLTTHYMFEAEELCDHVAIIDQGRLQACDTPAELKKSVQKQTTLELTIYGLEPLPESWHTLSGVIKLVARQDHVSQMTHLNAVCTSPEVSGELIRTVATDGRRLLDLRTVQPTLEDVFINLTGRSLTEVEMLPDIS